MPVLWIDPYPARFPGLNDIKRICTTKAHNEQEAPPHWLTILKPKALPIEPLPWSGWANKLLWQTPISKVSAFASKSSCLLVVGKPSVLALQLLAKHCFNASLYDAMDDFPSFHSGLAGLAMAKREQKIVERVSTVWASSTTLYNHWQQQHPNVLLVPNALDPATLSKLETSLPSPRNNQKKVLGYVGTISNWFDWDWVITLARAQPDAEIRLIGPLLKPPPTNLPNNIRLLPPCNHLIALKAITEFDAGLIPFKNNKLTESVDPIKYYEYRALNVPVVSTNFGEMRFRQDTEGVFISFNHTMEEIKTTINKALKFDSIQANTQGFMQENTWEARFNATGMLG